MDYWKKIRIVDKTVLEEVTEQPCLSCFQRPSDPHHITTRGAGGGDTYDNVMPLCRKHHTEWHQKGPVYMFTTYRYIKTWLVKYKRQDILDKEFK